MRHAARLAAAVLLTAAATGFSAYPAAAAGGGPRVGSNHLVDLDHGLAFPNNKQNEPAITRDPVTGVLVAGANDEISQPYCPGTTAALASPCPFAPGAPTSAYYVSSDNGQSWNGGYLPGFGTIGRTSGGDPSLDYGPARCAGGSFAYSCGVPIYYASLADPNGEIVAGEQATVSRTLDDGTTWSNPVQVTQNGSNSYFYDHEWVAVDHTAGFGSRHFGRVYLFYAQFCNFCLGGNVKLFVAHSDDMAQTWSAPVQVSSVASNGAQGFRETGQMTVASDGTVEAFWTENADSTKYPSVQTVATSTDGGATFNTHSIATVADYPLTGTPFDTVDLYNRVPGMSARVDCYPHPAADPASTKVYVVWCDFSGGTGVVKAADSADGVNWTQLGTVGSVTGRNAFFPEVSVSPSGTVAIAFDATAYPAGYVPGDPSTYWPVQSPGWSQDVYDAYYVESSATGFSAPVRLSSASSFVDGSSYNNVQEQFIGDYIGIVAGPSNAYAVWTDSRGAAPCQAVDSYRLQVYGGSKSAVAPNPDAACATGFGNTDTVVAAVAY